MVGKMNSKYYLDMCKDDSCCEISPDEVVL